MVCNALVAGGRLLVVLQQAMCPGWGNFRHPGCIPCCPAPDRRPPATKALHTVCGNNTSILSSSWWWAYECPKHVEQIIIAIKHSVASSWFSSLRFYYDARTNIHQSTDEVLVVRDVLPCRLSVKLIARHLQGLESKFLYYLTLNWRWRRYASP